MKRDKWKQNNPADQIVAISSGIQGYASNLAEGMYSPERAKEVGKTIAEWTMELVELARMIPNSEWPNH